MPSELRFCLASLRALERTSFVIRLIMKRLLLATLFLAPVALAVSPVGAWPDVSHVLAWSTNKGDRCPRAPGIRRIEYAKLTRPDMKTGQQETFQRWSIDNCTWRHAIWIGEDRLCPNAV